MRLAIPFGRMLRPFPGFSMRKYRSSSSDFLSGLYATVAQYKDLWPVYKPVSRPDDVSYSTERCSYHASELREAHQHLLLYPLSFKTRTKAVMAISPIWMFDPQCERNGLKCITFVFLIVHHLRKGSISQPINHTCQLLLNGLPHHDLGRCQSTKPCTSLPIFIVGGNNCSARV